jgi:hypothetical protein
MAPPTTPGLPTTPPTPELPTTPTTPTTAATTSTTAPTTTTTPIVPFGFVVSSFGASAYVIDGLQNPNITLTRGRNYVFQVDASGHPFWIKTVQGTTQINAYSPPGMQNNGVSQGLLTFFAVPTDAPDLLYYNCEFHEDMTGFINVINGTSVMQC